MKSSRLSSRSLTKVRQTSAPCNLQIAEEGEVFSRVMRTSNARRCLVPTVPDKIGCGMPIVPLIVLSVSFVAGSVMLFCPLMIYRTSESVYTREFLNKFATRVTTRALGVLFMLFCIAVLVFMLSRYRELSKGLFAALLVLFGFVW